MKKITKLEVLSDWQLKLTYSDGKTIVVHFKNKIVPGTVTEPLSDLQVFNRVQIAQGGRSIEWPGEIDFCADSLWLEGSGEVNPFLKSEKAS